ncbi:MAG: IS256 family transposase [Acidobacteria bacterium]|nr:IS256 family transposase [Acidobacteriota bacterium]
MDNFTETRGKIVEINEGLVRDHLGEIVRSTVEDTLNQLLDSEAERLCNAEKFERTERRKDSRAGHYTRSLDTSAGRVQLKVPKLRKGTFETAIIERYKRRESSVEEALIEMYLAGVSMRRVENITEVLWGTKVSPSTVSKLNKKVYSRIEAWRNRRLEQRFPYVYLDGMVLKRSWAGEVNNVSVLIAIGVDEEGYRQVLGVAEGMKEDKEGWLGFMRYLKQRGLRGVELVTSDACIGLRESLKEMFPEAKWQRCIVHFYRNVFGVVPRQKMKEVSHMLKAIHASEDHQAAMEKAEQIATKLEAMKLKKAAKKIRDSTHETLTYYGFPDTHWRRIRTNNPLERLIKEVRRRTKVIGAFPDGHAALMLCAARLRHVSGTKWGIKRYLDMEPLYYKQAAQEDIVS